MSSCSFSQLNATHCTYSRAFHRPGSAIVKQFNPPPVACRASSFLSRSHGLTSTANFYYCCTKRLDKTKRSYYRHGAKKSSQLSAHGSGPSETASTRSAFHYRLDPRYPSFITATAWTCSHFASCYPRSVCNIPPFKDVVYQGATGQRFHLQKPC